MRVALLVSFGLAFVLAALLALEAMQPWSADDTLAEATGVVPASRVRLPAAAPAGETAPQMHGEEWVAAILARPLFTRDRRPAKASSTVASSDSGSTLPRLTGIAISPERRRAIFAGADGAKPIVVDEGGSIDGFTVQTIAPDGIKVDGPGGERSVALAFDPNPPAATPSPDQGQPQPPNQPPFFGQPGLGQPGQPGQPPMPPIYPGYGQPFAPNRGGPLGPNGQPYVRQPFGRPRAELFSLPPDSRSS